MAQANGNGIPLLRSHGAPWGLRFRSSDTSITVVMCVAVFTDTFLYSLIVPILPDELSKRAHIPPDQIQGWISTLLGAFGLGHLITSPLIGYLADRIQSRRAPMLVGLLAMCASTMMYCVGTSPRLLLVARALQGASAAIIWVVGLALLIDTMGVEGSGYAMGWSSIALCAGSTIGPFAGGAIYDVAGHNAVFGVAFAVLAIDLALRFAMVERKDAEKWVTQVQKQVYGTTETSAVRDQLPARDTQMTPNATEDTDLIYSAQSSRRSSESIKLSPAPSHLPAPLRLLCNARVLAALWVTLVTSLMICALEAVLPLYTRHLFDWSPTLSGACLGVILIPVIIDPLIGILAASRTYRAFLACLGLVLTSFAFFALARVTPPVTIAGKVLLWAMIGVAGLGFILAATPTMLDIGSVTEDGEERCPGMYGPGGGVATSYGLYNVASACGSLTGSVLAGWAVQHVGWAGFCIGLGSLYAGSALLVALYCGGGIRERWIVREKPSS